MVAPYLSRIDAAISTCRDPIEADCLAAERASYVAREGRIEEARRTIREIQSRYGDTPSARVTAWCNFAEGVAFANEPNSKSARDRLKRAHALASAVKATSLVALSAAWLSHLDYWDLDFVSMIPRLEEALTDSRAAGHGATARATLVVAAAYHIADRYGVSRRWYEISRDHALADGDELMLSNRMHNMAWTRVANVRHAIYTNRETMERDEFLRLGAESMTNFDRMIGVTALQSWGELLNAQVAILLGDFSKALELIRCHSDSFASDGMTRLSAGVLADRALCEAHLGLREQAWVSAEMAAASVADDMHADDRAVAHSRLADTFAILDNRLDEERQRSLAANYWTVFEALQADWLRRLDAASFASRSFPV